MALKTYDDYLKRIADGYWYNYPLWGEVQTAGTSVFSSPGMSVQRMGGAKTMPTLPSGVTNYIVSEVGVCHTAASVNKPVLIGKLVSFGTISYSGTGATFTDGVQMPTVTELGVSRQLASPVFIEVTTAISAGSTFTCTLTYVDQDGNTAEASTTSHTHNSAVAAGSVSAFALNGTDYGARDITNYTVSGLTSGAGAATLWGMAPIALVTGSTSSIGTLMGDNLLMHCLNPVRLGAGDVIGMFLLNSLIVGSAVGNMFIVGDN